MCEPKVFLTVSNSDLNKNFLGAVSCACNAVVDRKRASYAENICSVFFNQGLEFVGRFNLR
jgi:hypothetical protein